MKHYINSGYFHAKLEHIFRKLENTKMLDFEQALVHTVDNLNELLAYLAQLNGVVPVNTLEHIDYAKFGEAIQILFISYEENLGYIPVVSFSRTISDDSYYQKWVDSYYEYLYEFADLAEAAPSKIEAFI